MTTAALTPDPLAGTSHYTASLPDVSADPWSDVAWDLAVPFANVNGVNPNVSIEAITRLVTGSNPSMLTDYYGRIHVIPGHIDLRNPPLGQPQSYSLWSAFLEPRTLDSIVEVGTTGLVNSAVPPVSFRATELKEFSITVTALSPIIIDAQYTFTFDQGSGVLIFRAERAQILNIVPETPFVQTLNYNTNILKAHDGTEQRIGVRAYPRQSLSGRMVAENDQQARELRALMFLGVVAPVVMPVWYEAFSLTAEAALGSITLTGDFSLADWLVDDFAYIESPDGNVSELVKLLTVSDPTLTVTNGLTATYPVGSKVYPTMTGSMKDNSGFNRYPVNLSIMDFNIEGFERRALGGKTASINTYKSLPLLDIRPLNNSLIDEGFNLRAEKIDFGGVYQVEFSQAFANISRPTEFIISDRDDLQFWKLFLDTVSGRREPFYIPTFREDLTLFIQPDIGGSVLTVNDDPNYLTDWFPSVGHRDLVLTNGDGDRLYRGVLSVVDNLDGTLAISLDSALPGTAQGSNILFIEFLELVRLDSDQIVLSHHVNHSVVGLRVATTEE